MADDRESTRGPLDTVERRRHSRSYVAGVAVLSHTSHGEGGACLVRNLSTEGALLLSSPPLAPGQTCTMVLSAPGLMGEEIDVRVNRAGTSADGAPWAAVEFVGMSNDKTNRLSRLVELELLAANAPAILVVDGSVDKLRMAADQLAIHSRKAYLANTCLTAVNWLEERGRRIALALVGENVVGTTTAAMLDYIGEDFPRIHRAELDREPTEDGLRKLLDRTEAESPEHPPWRLSEFK